MPKHNFIYLRSTTSGDWLECSKCGKCIPATKEKDNEKDYCPGYTTGIIGDN